LIGYYLTSRKQYFSNFELVGCLASRDQYFSYIHDEKLL